MVCWESIEIDRVASKRGTLERSC
jgi:hypothetical protein